MHRRSMWLLALVVMAVLLPGTASATITKNCPTGQVAPKRLPLAYGNIGTCVSVVQRILRDDGLLSPQNATGGFFSYTQGAVTSFQIRVGLPAVGYVGQETMAKLTSVRPNLAAIPAACLQAAKVLCVDKLDAKLRYFVAGKLALTLDARFGDARGDAYRTKEGVYTVLGKVKNEVSRKYNNAPMPDTLYFSDDGAAVHYSPDFAAQGYDGASHGCVNVRDRASMDRLFKQVPVGAAVVIY